MGRWVRLFIIGLLIILLMLVRAYGAKLFYDPFISYFGNDYLHKGIPDYNTLKLFFNILLRYLLNASVSLGIIYFAFFNKRLIRFSIKFYIVAFIILSIVYYGLLKTEMVNGYLFSFYVRRFLIHPVFVLILLPAFYYQKKLVRQEKLK